ncbi:uncharacterized protein K460DRAFT_269035, partial [Cucurbitaria berberidis CBS 394.84]
ETEADVVEASALYILAPIYEILHELYAGKWVRSAERTHVTPNEEAEEKECVRYDLTFQTPSYNGIQGETIAILEYKKRNMIRYDDFKATLLSAHASEITIQSLKDEIEDQDKETYLQRNAQAYSKQVCKYAATSRCQHVALFNWDNLLLYRFDRAKIGKGDTGDQANLTWVNESGIGGKFVQKCYIRKAILGWILKAFED